MTAITLIGKMYAVMLDESIYCRLVVQTRLAVLNHNDMSTPSKFPGLNTNTFTLKVPSYKDVEKAVEELFKEHSPSTITIYIGSELAETIDELIKEELDKNEHTST